METNNRRKILEKQYEHAAFALLLDNLMVEEGTALLRETNSSENFGISPEADERCMRAIRRSQARERRHQALRSVGKAVSRVAVVFLVVAIAFSVPFCTVSAFRDATLGYVLRTFDVGADISLYGTSAPQPYLGGGHPTWFPDGSWILTETTRDDTMYLVKYEDAAGDCIEYTELTASGSGITIDTQDGKVRTDVLIRNCPATISIKENRCIAVWLDEENDIFCMLLLYGDHIDTSEETLIRIAENIN